MSSNEDITDRDTLSPYLISVLQIRGAQQANTQSSSLGTAERGQMSPISATIVADFACDEYITETEMKNSQKQVGKNKTCTYQLCLNPIEVFHKTSQNFPTT